MNPILSETLVNHTPRINDELVNGISKKVFEHIPEYVSNMIKISFDKLNPNINLQYLGYKLVSPEEELMEDIYSRSSNSTGDIATNDVYMCKYQFMYNNTPISRYLYFGYCNKGNIINISGTAYVVTPVLTDLVFSVLSDRIFIKLHSDKIYVMSRQYRVIKNDNPSPLIYQVLNGSVSIARSKNTTKSSVRISFVFYLLCKYGLVETLSKYGGVSRRDFMILHDPKDEIYINNPKYKDLYKEYDIYSTTGDKPRGYDQLNQYQKHHIKVAIRKTLAMSPLLTNLMVGIILCFDMYNGHIEKDLVHYIDTNNIVDEIKTWRILLGRYLYKRTVSLTKITEDLNELTDALEDYIDPIIRAKLNNAKISIYDFWDMVAYITNIYTEAVNNAKEYNANVNHVYMDILYYVCYDIIVGFNKAVKSINQRYSKNGQNQPSKQEITKLLSMNVSPKVIYKLVKSRRRSLALQQVDVAHDSLYYKCTALLENQNRGDGVLIGGKTKFPDTIKQLTGHHLVFGSLLYLIKAAPSPTLRMNPWAKFDSEGNIIITDDLKPAVEALDKILRGLTEAPEEIINGINSMLDDDVDDKTEGVENDESEYDNDDEATDAGDDE